MNEKEILTASMAEHQRAIDKAKAELEQLDKPKLRHGDYGYYVNGRTPMAIDKIEGIRGISVRNPEKMKQPECAYYLELTKIITEQCQLYSSSQF